MTEPLRNPSLRAWTVIAVSVVVAVPVASTMSLDRVHTSPDADSYAAEAFAWSDEFGLFMGYVDREHRYVIQRLPNGPSRIVNPNAIVIDQDNFTIQSAILGGDPPIVAWIHHDNAPDPSDERRRLYATAPDDIDDIQLVHEEIDELRFLSFAWSERGPRMAFLGGFSNEEGILYDIYVASWSGITWEKAIIARVPGESFPTASARVALVALSEGKDGALHLVYSVERADPSDPESRLLTIHDYKETDAGWSHRTLSDGVSNLYGVSARSLPGANLTMLVRNATGALVVLSDAAGQWTESAPIRDETESGWCDPSSGDYGTRATGGTLHVNATGGVAAALSTFSNEPGCSTVQVRFKIHEDGEWRLIDLPTEDAELPGPTAGWTDATDLYTSHWTWDDAGKILHADRISLDDSPLANFTYPQQTLTTRTSGAFTDNSIPAGGRSLASWSWDFGDDGGSTGQNPSHTFSSRGRYWVKLTVTDGEGSTDWATAPVQVDQVGPTACFDAATNGLAIDVSASCSEHPESDKGATLASTDWTFGDGDAADGPTASHLYDLPGTYTVTLTVTDEQGMLDTASQTVSVEAPPSNQKPSVDFSWSPTNPKPGQAVVFTAHASDSDGSIESLDWSLAGQAMGSGVTWTHAFAEAGPYTVSVTATDDDDATALREKTVAVTRFDPPVFSLDPAQVETRGGRSLNVTLRVLNSNPVGLNATLSVKDLASGWAAEAPSGQVPVAAGSWAERLVAVSSPLDAAGVHFLTFESSWVEEPAANTSVTFRLMLHPRTVNPSPSASTPGSSAGSPAAASEENDSGGFLPAAPLWAALLAVAVLAYRWRR